MRNPEDTELLKKDELLIRYCPATKHPVLVYYDGDGMCSCLHNDTVEEDMEDVKRWLNEMTQDQTNSNMNYDKEVYDYIKEREIDDIATYDHELVIELASDYVGDHIAPEDLDEEYGNSDEYVDLLDWWCEIFSYDIAELAMCHYFEKHKHLVDR